MTNVRRRSGLPFGLFATVCLERNVIVFCTFGMVKIEILNYFISLYSKTLFEFVNLALYRNWLIFMQLKDKFGSLIWTWQP
jgi:hypothetical protein